MSLHRLRFITVLILLLCINNSASADSDSKIILSQLQTEDFPTIHANLEPFDANGDFIHDLKPEDVSISEDNRLIPVNTLEKAEVGTQFLVALNQGPPFAIRDSNGISRFDTLKNALNVWAENHSSIKDDLSFITNGGVETLHTGNGREWLQGFQAFEEDFRTSTPSLDVLIRAIEVATEPQNQPEKGKSILLLTPPPELPSAGTLQTIFALAQNENVHINIWMVSSTDLFTSRGAIQLAELAEQTGGDFFAFSGSEPIPDVDSYLEALRYIYHLNYESEIRDNVTHQVFAKLDFAGLHVESNIHSFELLILPPNPIFVSPPLEISRKNDAPLTDALSEINTLKPTKQEINILVEFPDGFTRPLVRTTLYVDGLISDENRKPPFELLTWDLTSYENSQNHLLTIEAEDSLGLKGSSITQTILITVKQGPQQVLSTIADNAPIISGAAAALTGGILLLVLIMKGHIRPRAFGRKRRKRRAVKKRTSSSRLNAAEPLNGRKSARSQITRFVDRLKRPTRRLKNSLTPQANNVVGYLEFIEPDRRDKGGGSIPVQIGIITFGNDSSKATIHLNDNAICNLHARLVVTDEVNCRIYDEGSIAGTWINYRPVPPEGDLINHGDIIHIGRIGFQYKLDNKERIPKPLVLPSELQL